MNNLKDAINAVIIKDKKSGYQIEHDEHYASVLSIVKDEQVAERIIQAIVKDHERENPNYYEEYKS